MISRDDVYRIGRIGKAHGVRGEVTMLCDDDVFDRVESDHLILEIDGLLVPFYMEEYRFRTDTTVLIKFEDIDTQQRARELTGSDVYFLRSEADTDEESLSWASIVGFTLKDANMGTGIGRVASIDDTTANLLFCLDDGRLIPAAEDLIDNIDVKGKEITINIPEGLLEL